MSKKMETEFEANKTKIEKLVARQKDLELRMKARTNYKKRKERTHRMCLLAGDIAKIYKNVVRKNPDENLTIGKSLFDDNFDLNRKWVLHFFEKYFEFYHQQMIQALDVHLEELEAKKTEPAGGRGLIIDDDVDIDDGLDFLDKK